MTRAQILAGLDPLRPYASLLRWGLIALQAGLLVALGYHWGASTWKDKHAVEVAARAGDNAGHAATLQRLADSTAAVAAKAKAASKAVADSRSAADTRYEKALNDAKRAQSDLAAALRRGSVQLRPEWACAAPGAGAGGAAVFAAGQDAAADLRAAGAANLIAGAARADAWIGWLQQELIATRQAVIAAGCAVEAAGQ